MLVRLVVLNDNVLCSSLKFGEVWCCCNSVLVLGGAWRTVVLGEQAGGALGALVLVVCTFGQHLGFDDQLFANCSLLHSLSAKDHPLG